MAWATNSIPAPSVNPFDSALDRALDSLASQDSAAVRSALEELQTLSQERRRAMVKARHDLGNVLSILNASVEAMLDGVAPVTQARLSRMRELLEDASAALYALTPDAD